MLALVPRDLGEAAVQVLLASMAAEPEAPDVEVDQPKPRPTNETSGSLY